MQHLLIFFWSTICLKNTGKYHCKRETCAAWPPLIDDSPSTKHASVLTLVIVDDFLIKKYSKTTSIDHIFTYFSIKTISNKIIYLERDKK